MVTYHDIEVPVEDLLVDPNNYRFQDAPDFVTVSKERYAESTVQERALRRLRDSGLKELKDSIVYNGFLTFERIVVTPYADGQYLVLEGNRRVAALKSLKSDYQAGVDIPQNVISRFAAVPVLSVEGIDEEPDLRLSLMGIRHVGGIKEWGAFQRAQLVTQLRDEHGLDTASVAARLGMTAHEVNRRFRAYKALEQMMDDEEFGDRATPEMYPLFHEAVAGSAIKDWLEWNEAESRFDNLEQLHKFYSLLVSSGEPNDSEGVVSPKITSREAVRDLREILPLQEARRKLFDEGSSYAEALALAKADDLAQSWVTQVAEAVFALRKVGALELRHLDDDSLQEVRALHDLAGELLDLHALYSQTAANSGS